MLDIVYKMYFIACNFHCSVCNYMIIWDLE